MSWEPQQLKARHFLAAALQAMGHSNGVVAQTVGFTKEYISLLSQSALFQAEVRRLTLQLQSKLVTDAARRLEGELTNNINTMVAVRDDVSVGAAVRLRAANDLMDHVPGMARNQRSAVEAPQLQFTESQTQLFLNALADDPDAEATFRGPPVQSTEEEESLFQLVETMISDEQTQPWDPQMADIVIHEA